jgi:hypothetical protein
MSGSFHVNLSFLGIMVLQIFFLKNDTTLFLRLPPGHFEEDLALYLINFEFSSPQGRFVPSSTEIGLLVLEKNFVKKIPVLLSFPLGQEHCPSFK